MATQDNISVSRNHFHQQINYSETDLFILKNSNQVEAAITNYGARWIRMDIPCGDTKYNVVAGFNSINDYIQSTEKYYSAVVGRYANRIANGSFSLDGNTYQLPLNNPPNHLHGGLKGFHDVVWEVLEANDHSIVMEYISEDGEEGYPGTLTVKLTYTLNDDDELEFFVQAKTNKATPVNIVHHAFFNLNGFDKGDVLDHQLTIHANYFTPVNDSLIPTGEIKNVANTPFDFRAAKKIGAQIFADDAQLKFGKGYDHNFILDKPSAFSKAAKATGNISGISVEIFTTEPGLQLYTGNVMKGENLLQGIYKDEQFHAFCLETQHFPDSPNQSSFPSVILQPGELYQTKTVFKFSKDRV